MELFLSISSIYALSVGSLGVLLFFSVFAMVWMLWLMPVRKNNKLRNNGFHGPSPRFPFGNLKEMRNITLHQVPSSPSSGDNLRTIISHDIHSIAFSYFAQWRKTFGRVFVYWLGTEPFLYVSEPEFLKKVTSGSLSKSWGKPNVFKYDRKPMFGKGLNMVEGDEWDHHRHIIAPAFSMKNLNGMQNLMVETTTNMIEEWKKLMDMGNHEINVEEYIVRNAAVIIAKTSFGISDEDGKMVFEKLQTMQTMLFKSNRLVGVPFSKLLSPKNSQEEWKLGKEIDKLLHRIIKSRKDQACTTTNYGQQDLLSILLEGNQALKKKLTTQELVDESKTFFFGGHETTALAITWTLFLLAMYPQWQKLLREEIMEVSNGDPLDSTMLTKLIKMGWVFNETLRLYSPAPNAQRQAREDIRVGDIFIPKGTNMWIDIVAMHHDRELWGDDVHEFKPERFMENNNGGCKHRMGFMPFGFSGRVCVGRNLSITEYKIVLSLILQKFSFSLSPSYLHSPKIMLSLRPSFGVPLIVHPI